MAKGHKKLLKVILKVSGSSKFTKTDKKVLLKWALELKDKPNKKSYLRFLSFEMISVYLSIISNLISILFS